MSMIPRVTEEGFLCRVSSNSFVAEIDGNTISTTPIPSAAKHMSYQDSDRMTQYLRRRAYRSAVVTDYLGLPVSADAIRAAIEPSKATEKLPATLKELDSIPTPEQRRRRKESPEFNERWLKLNGVAQ